MIGSGMTRRRCCPFGRFLPPTYICTSKSYSTWTRKSSKAPEARALPPTERISKQEPVSKTRSETTASEHCSNRGSVHRAWMTPRIEVLQQYSTQHDTLSEELCNVCLEILSEYSDWIDISFMVNPVTLQTLFTLVESPVYVEKTLLTFEELIGKGMSALDKISLIRSLTINILVCLLRSKARLLHCTRPAEPSRDLRAILHRSGRHDADHRRPRRGREGRNRGIEAMLRKRAD